MGRDAPDVLAEAEAEAEFEAERRHADRHRTPGPAPGPAPQAGAVQPHRWRPRGTDRAVIADIVVVGAGAAGLSLAGHLLDTAPEGRAAPSIVLVEPPPAAPARSAERTWCFWEEGPGELDRLLAATWSRLLVRGRDGTAVTTTGAPPYKAVRSADYTRALHARLDAAGVRRVTGTVTGVRDVRGGAEASGTAADGGPLRLRGRWLFDSRPPRPLPPARTTLLQHFRGWYVTTDTDRFDPSTAELMDFRADQPRTGPAFAYVLPFTPRQALVEYTVFSAGLLPTDAYETALRRYAEDVRPLGPYRVTGTEQGVIPMTDGTFPRRTGASVFRIGTAGGAVRPATGYAFAAIRRQTAAVAAAYHAGRTPQPPRPHTRRHLAMDAVMLRALATGRVDGAAFFEDLFRRNPPERVLRFLDGRSTLRDEWAVGRTTPVLPMLRSLAELPLVRRRTPPDRPAAPRPAPHPHGKAPV